MIELAEEQARFPRQNPIEVSDGSLLRRVQSGSEDAATQLYLRYARRLRGLVEAQSSPDLKRMVDAEEIVQSIFGSFFRGATSGLYHVPVGEEMWKRFLVIALTKIRAKGAFHRAAKRDMRRTADEAEIDHHPETRETTDLGFLRLSVAEAMERLPEQHRTMVRLRIEGHEVEEIARQTGR